MLHFIPYGTSQCKSNITSNVSYSLAHLCWVIKPWDACNGVSSAPLNRKIILWMGLSSSLDIILKISNITATLIPSSLAPKHIYTTIRRICTIYFSLPNNMEIRVETNHMSEYSEYPLRLSVSTNITYICLSGCVQSCPITFLWVQIFGTLFEKTN